MLSTRRNGDAIRGSEFNIIDIIVVERTIGVINRFRGTRNRLAVTVPLVSREGETGIASKSGLIDREHIVEFVLEDIARIVDSKVYREYLRVAIIVVLYG